MLNHYRLLSRNETKGGRARVAARGWPHVETARADVTTWRPPAGGAADVVTLSYALTMIPDWFRAVDNAWAMLRPGGVIGVADFYVSRRHPAAGHVRHGWAPRTLWPIWFGADTSTCRRITCRRSNGASRRSGSARAAPASPTCRFARHATGSWAASRDLVAARSELRHPDSGGPCVHDSTGATRAGRSRREGA